MSAGCDRQLENPQKDHGNLSSVMMTESIDNSELELVNQNCFGTNLEQELGCKHAGYAQDKTLINILTSPTVLVKVICKGTIIFSAINGLDRCWSPHVRVDFFAKF